MDLRTRYEGSNHARSGYDPSIFNHYQNQWYLNMYLRHLHTSTLPNPVHLCYPSLSTDLTKSHHLPVFKLAFADGMAVGQVWWLNCFECVLNVFWMCPSIPFLSFPACLSICRFLLKGRQRKPISVATELLQTTSTRILWFKLRCQDGEKQHTKHRPKS